MYVCKQKIKDIHWKQKDVLENEKYSWNAVGINIYINTLF